MTEIVMGTLLIVVLVLFLCIVVIAVRALLVPALPVEISVNGSLNVSGTTGQKLLSLLNQADIPVPSACAGAGTCGLCKVKVTKGGDAPLPTELARLSRADLGEGQRLACQLVVRAPLSLVLPEDILTAESWTARVVSNRMLAPLIKELVLEVPSGMDFDFRAGAYMQLEAPPYKLDFSSLTVDQPHEKVWHAMGWRQLVARNEVITRRAYSIATRPKDRGKIVFNIRLAVPPPGSDTHIPPGIVSSYLFNLAPGDSIKVSGPFGDFGVQNTDREMVFIGGGVGMAPLRAMIHEQLAAGTARKISFWYGARSGTDIFYADEFDQLAAEYRNFSWTLALSEPMPDDQWTGACGFIHEVVFRHYLATHPAPEDCEFYLCGPPLMIQTVLAMLDSCGVEPAAIFNDDFGI
ncbi:NADH:ubiquinone reductase (Na(+)-transporting) subunit F [Maritalea mediterranea]|uniref:Na(+)-translocating NADH-quinone reductase subunit F n=1 Tax=Maritalea mediterranea TaxID=2909667 RepID=A0ABS9E8Z3_9HYPH|nr:NADH:ubiquinone reductase (Na(+)-transporting) subunit F [Maritalea mediterranea]MCF4098369.1 NADH:ubiquinone reductase (Na(+)-transporting) subunit F [Maritalea mediterranea]